MMATRAHIERGHRLPSFALFAGLLAAAGLPIYIHAPRFFVDAYGVSLAGLGGVLFILRLLDVVQDPALGWLARRLQQYRATSAGIAVALLAAAMVGLFAVTPPVAPLLWFAAMLMVLFSSYSYLSIIFYAQGVAKAATVGDAGHLRVARWRETGALSGVCIAAVAPVMAAFVAPHPFTVFAAGFAGISVIAAWAMQTEWSATAASGPFGFGVVLKDHVARKLLMIALVNAAPVAVSATLFLFFVESRLAAPGSEGVLLLLFFLSAAAAAPIWGRLADRFGTRRVLLTGMVLSILAFGGAVFTGAGDAAWFAVICIASGAALGADMTLLPAMFSLRLSRIASGSSEAFGLWSFATKLALALGAITLLPLLEAAGFRPGAENSPAALARLGLLYAGIPCLLKMLAVGLLLSLSPEDT